MSGVAILIVAAGASNRMKTPKQLLAFEDTTMLGKVVKQANASEAEEVIVVLGANIEKIRPSIAHFNATIVENEQWEQGIGTSIATGIGYLRQHRNFRGAMIVLADQPLMDAGYLNQLLQNFKENPSAIIATKYPKSNGVPAVFPENYFEELSVLKGDSGAKYLLNKKEIFVISVDPGTRIMDIDTPEEYEQMKKNHFGSGPNDRSNYREKY